MYSFTCCSKTFSDLRLYKNHVTSHMDTEGGIECNICLKFFASFSRYKAHMLYHARKKIVVETNSNDNGSMTDSQKRICHLCGKLYKNSYSLSYHVKKVHSKNFKHICNYCGKKFREKSVLNNHVLIHRIERKFKCTICNARFKQRTNLTVHKKSHGNPTTVKCTICSRVLKTQSILNRHMKTVHSKNDQLYMCALCPVTFNNRPAILSHLRRHRDVNGFKCHTCDKTYRTKSNLRKHVRIHTGNLLFAPRLFSNK